MISWLSQIEYLEINYEELAKLLRTTLRTVYRWKTDPETMPGAAVEAIKAWTLLKKNNIHWNDRVTTQTIEVRQILD
jgi:hypothetical protein